MIVVVALVHSSVGHRCFGDPFIGFSSVCRCSMLSLFCRVHLASVGGLVVHFSIGHQCVGDLSLSWTVVFYGHMEVSSSPILMSHFGIPVHIFPIGSLTMMSPPIA